MEGWRHGWCRIGGGHPDFLIGKNRPTHLPARNPMDWGLWLGWDLMDFMR